MIWKETGYMNMQKMQLAEIWLKGVKKGVKGDLSHPSHLWKNPVREPTKNT